MNIVQCGRLPAQGRPLGGIEVTLPEITLRLANRGHNVTLIGKNVPPTSLLQTFQKTNVRLYSIPAVNPFVYYPYMISRSISLLQQLIPSHEIVHSHLGVFAAAAALVNERGSNRHARTIVTVHEVIEPRYRRNDLTRYLSGYIENWLMRFASQRADVVIVRNRHMQDIIDRAWGIKRTVAIPDGIDTFNFRPIVGNLDQLWGRAKYKLLFVGRLEERKGILHLVRAMDILINKWEMKEVCLCIVGQGSLEKKVTQLVATFHLQDHVLLYGGATRQQLPMLYSSADYLVVPSIYEPFGLVSLEALACGTPVIVSANTGLAESVTEGVAVLLDKAEPQSIAATLRDTLGSKKPGPSLCRDFIVNHYDWSAIIDRYERVYSSTV